MEGEKSRVARSCETHTSLEDLARRAGAGSRQGRLRGAGDPGPGCGGRGERGGRRLGREAAPSSGPCA